MISRESFKYSINYEQKFYITKHTIHLFIPVDLTKTFNENFNLLKAIQQKRTLQNVYHA